MAGFAHAETREPSPWQVGGGLGLTMGGDELGSVDIYNSEGKRVQSENIRAGRLFRSLRSAITTMRPTARIWQPTPRMSASILRAIRWKSCLRFVLTGIRLAWDFATISAQQRLRPAVARPSSRMRRAALLNMAIRQTRMSR